MWYKFITSVYASNAFPAEDPHPCCRKTLSNMQGAKTGISTPPVVKGASLAEIDNDDSQPMPAVCQKAQAELSTLAIPAKGATSTTGTVGMPASATC